jgi:MFS family permease
MTLGMAWAADLWQGEARARFLGLQGAAMSAGGIVVMLLGGFAAMLHWRGAFAVYAIVLPIAVYALMMLAPHARRINAARLAPAAAAAPPAAFPWRAFAVVGPLGFVFMVTFYVIPTRLPFLMEALSIDNAGVIGATLALMTLVSVPGALMYGRIRQAVTPMAIFAFSFAMMGVGLILISQASGIALVIAGVILIGIGMGPSMPNYTTYFMAVVPPSLRGRASGMLTTAFFAGQFMSPLVTAPLVGQFGLSGSFAAVGVAMIVLGMGIALVGRPLAVPALLKP